VSGVSNANSAPSNPFRLDGDVAMITGGGTGIGLGIARCMVAAGARVVLVGRREAELATAAKELGAAASFLARDITRWDDAPATIADAERLAGPVSILVNNAGIHLKKPAVETSPQEFLTVLNTHVLSAHALTRAAAPGMVQRGRGSVLFVSSMAAFMGVPLVAAYAAAKSAYFGLVGTLSAELSPAGVRVNAIAPGWVTSAMSEAALARDPARKAKVMGRIPMNRMGRPEDIGHAAVYLCSPAAAYVTGHTLCVDGGAAVSF
jgi:gluconate 5-dehydrogenase